jgi:phosphopantetheine--protein transferase-like protein
MQSLRGGILMANIEELRLVVGELMQVPGDSLTGDTTLNGVLATSLGRARLDAALRSRFNIANQGVYTLKTFGELCSLSGVAVDGVNSAAAPIRKADIPAINGLHGDGVAIGVDLQSVNALPEANDFWECEFYRQHFTKQEIAYALLQAEPRESFAGTWCAKEALRKADKRWLDVDWQLTELVHDGDGRPMLRSGEGTIPCSLSLSHSNGFAMAAVVMGATPQVQSAAIAAPSISTNVRPDPPQISKVPLVLAGLALLLSLVTAGFEFLR